MLIFAEDFFSWLWLAIDASDIRENGRRFLKEFFEVKYRHNGEMVDAVDSKRSVHRLCICTGDDLAGSSPACATFRHKPVRVCLHLFL